MKKLFSLMIAVVIVLALPIFTVYAAYSAELTVTKSEAKTGETAEVLINIAANPGLCALGFEIEYDKDALKVTSAEFTDLFSAASVRVNIQDGKIIFNAASADNINGDGAVARIVFRVEKDGTHAVTAKPLGDKGFVLHSESDHSLHDVTLDIKAGHVATETTATDTPNTDAPVTDIPATDAPVTDIPATDAPVTEIPDTDAPADSTTTNAGDIKVQPIEDNNPTVIIIVIVAVVLAALLIVFAVFKAKADKNKREEDFF